MEVYVDDMITYESCKRHGETFKILRHNGIMLNPKKCTFGVRSKNVLGYIVDQREIETNPNEVQALLNMKSLMTVKEVQKMMGYVVALGRFM